MQAVDIGASRISSSICRMREGRKTSAPSRISTRSVFGKSRAGTRSRRRFNLANTVSIPIESNASLTKNQAIDMDPGF